MSNRRTSVWIFLLFLPLYVGTTRGHFVGTDEVNVYQTTRSLYERGEFTAGRTRNTARGRDGHDYSFYNAGLAFIAVPLYATGHAIERGLERAGKHEWVETLAGPAIGRPPWLFGGEVEIFFVNLTNALLTALLCALFFHVSVGFGASRKYGLIATLLLGTSTYVVPFSGGLLRHTAEALFLLGAVHFLILDGRSPSPRQRLWAGVMLGALFQVRLAAAIAMPALLAFALYHGLRRERIRGDAHRRTVRVFRALLPVVLPLAISFALYLAINWIKFESAFGHYGDGIESRFATPLLTGLYGLLLSPGASVFLFTPLLVFTPWLFRFAYARSRPETLLILTLVASYLLFYARFEVWHGLPSALGPRYLMALVPLLLLPLGTWLESTSTPLRLWIVPTVVFGVAVQLVQIAINFGHVFHAEGYPAYDPPFAFVFSLRDSPLLAQFRAFFDGSLPVDMWLVGVYERFGGGRVALLLLPLATCMSVAGWQLMRASRPPAEPADPART